MRKGILLLLAVATLAGCKFVAKEIKKTTKIRKAAYTVCECKYVAVDSDYDRGNASVTMTIRRSESTDYAVTADNIMTAVRDTFPKICNYAQIYIIFEGDEFDEQFTYYGCDGEPDRDTLYYEDIMTDDEWESFMEDEDSIP